MIQYVFRENEPIRLKAATNADPQVIGEALAKITEEAGGELSPKAVVDRARDKRHPLHQHFEWNDTAAAEAFRLDQARNLIRVVRVEDTSAQDGTSRAFISVNDGDRTAYRPLETIKRSADLQHAVLKQAQRDLEAWERRYRDLTDICKMVRAAREAVAKKLKRSEKRSESRVAA